MLTVVSVLADMLTSVNGRAVIATIVGANGAAKPVTVAALARLTFARVEVRAASTSSVAALDTVTFSMVAKSSA